MRLSASSIIANKSSSDATVLFGAVGTDGVGDAGSASDDDEDDDLDVSDSRL